MEPVVNGLAETYKERIEFRALNVDMPDGQQAFRAYALPGHPGYILLNPAGDVLWKSFGELAQETLADQLNTVLAQP